MPNPLLLVDTTGAVLPAATDYKTHLSDEAIDYAYLPNNFHPSNVEAQRFYYHCGILCHELLWNLPTVNEPRTIAYRPITLVSGATDCPPTNGYLGATGIRGHSLRFFVALKCKFLLSTYGTSSVLPIPNQSDGTCWKEETRNLMVVDQPTGSAYGDLITQWDSDIVKVGTIHYESGTVNIFGGEITLNHYRPTFGPDFAVHVTVAGVQNNRVYTWTQLVDLDTKRQQTAPVGSSGNGVWARMLITAVGTNLTAVKYATSSTAEDEKSVNVVLTSLGLQIPTAPNSPLTGVSFKVGDTLYTSLSDGTLVTNFNPVTGIGTPAGTVDLNTGSVQITNWIASASATVSAVHAAAPYGIEAYCEQITIRTASAPLRPGSLSIVGSTVTPRGAVQSFNVSADLDGRIVDDWVLGKVDHANGVVRLWFTCPTIAYPVVAVDAGGRSPDIKDYSFLEIPGVSTRVRWHAKTSSLRYNAVAYSYLPMDANLLGIDPVRLPSDGRVPIFRPGGFVVVGHTGEVSATVSNGQTINCARERLSRVRVVGHDGAVINTGYSANLNAGTVTFSDVALYSQPVTIQHRIEDMMMTSDVQINGQITFTRALTHDYPLGSYISSALVVNDLRARVSVIFDQASWNGATWTDAVTGSPAIATFNDAQFPITVTNRGALTERWVVQFTNTTAFNVIGENVGVIAAGNINTNCAPINPATGVPYFIIPAGGWGQGWSAGNVLRFNTIGAIFPIWCVRTVQQGPETVTNDNFTLLVRGDVDTP